MNRFLFFLGHHPAWWVPQTALIVAVFLLAWFALNNAFELNAVGLF
jgi:hypothetical protein